MSPGMIRVDSNIRRRISPKKSHHPTRKEPFIVRYSFGIRTVPEAVAMTHILRYTNPPSRLQDCPFSPIVPGRRACVSPHAGRSG